MARDVERALGPGRPRGEAGGSAGGGVPARGSTALSSTGGARYSSRRWPSRWARRVRRLPWGYAREFRWGIATAEDFKRMAEEACGCQLDELFEQWLDPQPWPRPPCGRRSTDDTRRGRIRTRRPHSGRTHRGPRQTTVQTLRPTPEEKHAHETQHRASSLVVIAVLAACGGQAPAPATAVAPTAAPAATAPAATDAPACDRCASCHRGAGRNGDHRTGNGHRSAATATVRTGPGCGSGSERAAALTCLSIRRQCAAGEQGVPRHHHRQGRGRDGLDHGDRNGPAGPFT